MISKKKSLFLCLFGNLVPNLIVSRNLVETKFAPLLYVKEKKHIELCLFTQG